MSTVTAFMIVKNEEALLPRCLRSLVGVADELVILDTGSTDSTHSILEQAAADGGFSRVRWDHHEFRDFSSARQANLDLVDTEWALWMDADEVLSNDLRDHLLALKQDGGLDAHTGWEIKRANRVLGRVMTSRGLNANYVMRLFRTARGRLNNTLVHEGIDLDPDATVGRIEAPLFHDTLTEIRPYLAKVSHYTTLDAATDGDKRFNPFHMLVTGPLTFLREYVSRGGFVDGWPGFVWCAISAYTSVNRDWKRFKRDWLR